ncbi:MAG TPA: PfkB family carbohydrate kinase, partial [Gemmataceae bacterium]|nr:PfkB family carbohydrate kinase [Gemmataceae bacterium]
VRPMMEYVAGRLNCQKVMVTQGKGGALGFDRHQGFASVPAFAGQIVDRVGGGDAFFSISAPCVALGASIELAAFLGNAAGAQAVATVGHRSSLEQQAFCRYIEHLLK